ncbi:hypothetical protein HMPREF0293_1326 [Corynebacterium glucuronolyticum ATCC 51866]|uniref:Uncharacterized protein n=1 Tax=Corynebacterium glucuronolyticum ATCC 51866 TaxID=548478 RepID=A0ABM9XPU5_9CORY|nr:hypothetical protein HMPREF0293_1326 [Corynebacterium glucuronolyticum ATCC 51866]
MPFPDVFLLNDRDEEPPLRPLFLPGVPSRRADGVTNIPSSFVEFLANRVAD